MPRPLGVQRESAFRCYDLTVERNEVRGIGKDLCSLLAIGPETKERPQHSICYKGGDETGELEGK